MLGMRHALPPIALRPFWCFPRCFLSGRSFSPPPPPTCLAFPCAHGASPAPPRPQLAKLSHLSCTHSAMAAMDPRSDTTLSPRSSLPRLGHPDAIDGSTRDTPLPFRSSAVPPPFLSAKAASSTGMAFVFGQTRPPIREKLDGIGTQVARGWTAADETMDSSQEEELTTRPEMGSNGAN